MYASHWTVAGLYLVGSADTYASAVTLERAEDQPLSEGQRLVGNDITSGYYLRGGVHEAAMQLQELAKRDDLDYYQRARITARITELRLELAKMGEEETER